MREVRCDQIHVTCDGPIYLLPIPKMVSYGMLRRVAIVRTDVSEELIASFIRVTRIGELRTKWYVKNGVFWVVTPCVPCKNRRFGGT
jgi:hypothetical protein